MSGPKGDRLDDFREAQNTSYEPDPLVHTSDDLPVIDDEDDDSIGLDDERDPSPPSLK